MKRVQKFRADDGAEFDTEAACLEHEALAAAIPMPRIHSTYAGGEVMGVVMGENDQPDYLLIDLGVEPENAVTWDEAKAWAKAVGGDLPTRREQAVMFGNRREGQYKARWYWSGEAHASEPSWAWGQLFLNGNQFLNHKDTRHRARAVRRVPFQ